MRNGSSKRQFQYAIGALLVGLTLYWLVARRADEAKIIADSRFLMDTLVTIKAWGDEAEQITPLLDAAFEEIERLEGVMSARRRDSEISRINEGASGAWIPMSADVASVLGRALFFSRLSDRACDVTIGPVMSLWGFSTTAPHVPDEDEIVAALERVGADKMEVTEGKVRHLKGNMALDLGAIAKGYAVDRAVRVLERGGASGGLVDAGGDLRFFGTKPGGRRWRIALAHPRKAGTLIEIGEMPLHSVATSGDYERFFEADGRRYHHLLDPRTGYPSRRAVSATVWARTCMDADMLSTTLFVMGPDGIPWIQGLDEVEGWVIYEADGELKHRASNGVAGKVEMH
jgi:thiamine biosynthesis lipoprotein